MQRLSNINRTTKELGITNTTDPKKKFENEIKSTFRVNDKEWDFIVKNCNTEEMDLLIQKTDYTFTQKRKAIKIINDYLSEMYERSNISELEPV